MSDNKNKENQLPKKPILEEDKLKDVEIVEEDNLTGDEEMNFKKDKKFNDEDTAEAIDLHVHKG